MPDKDMETLVAGFTIPPQPKLMLDIEKVYPDIDKIALVVQRDQGVATHG